MSENNSNPVSVGGIIAAFTIGAAIGAGIALLYAPRSGAETRKLLAQKGNEFKGRAEDALEDAKEYIRAKKQEVAVAVEAGKEAIREERARHSKSA